MKLKLLKWAKHGNFGADFLISSKPARVGTYNLKEKIYFWTFDAAFLCIFDYNCINRMISMSLIL
jgi:hypothetical protein